MNRPPLIITAVALCITVAACNSNKPKPASDSITKTTVTVNGKKDSVINNPQKNYGNATIADPCVKCLLQIIQADSLYKKSVAGAKPVDLKYVVNYVKTTQPQDSVVEVKQTNALRVDVLDKQAKPHKLASFIYDNAAAKFYFLDKTTKSEMKIDSLALKRVRNGCYWGVASGK